MAKFFILDVFAEAPLAGNPLAVVLGDAWDTATLQAIAREMAYSETTFVGKPDARGRWPVRIFTPATEVPFAGHPTIGTASLIRDRLLAAPEAVLTLVLGVGEVEVRFAGEGVAWMRPPRPELGPERDRDLIPALLGLETSDLDERFPVQDVSAGIPFTLIPLRDRAAVGRARYRAEGAAALRAVGASTAVFLFAPEAESSENQLRARMFAPDFGVAEDPATGSANACLGRYIEAHRYPGYQLPELRVEQGYEIGRPSLLRLRLKPHLQVGGRVIPVAEGILGLDGPARCEEN